ncbi:MAG TPA: monovalent cation/H+ antiporter subunit A [Devosia sp.]|nr:monovalent cation/H+ antiporter subunit A [Devosia sp.]
MLNSVSLLISVLLPFVGSLAVGLLPLHARGTAATISGAVAAVLTLIAVLSYGDVAAQGVLRYELQWLPQLGLNLVIRMDGLSWLFMAMISGIGGLVVLYARYYMSPKDPVPRFFSLLLAFMGAMLGMVLSGNLIQLVLFWELTSMFSFLLIGYWHQNAAARDGARMALVITGTGGLALFAGMLLLGHIVGSFDLDVVLASGDLVRAHPLYTPTLLLVLLAAFTKSAQFPFHFWLPRAMSAPTPVSAYLHSATMVKAGVFLLALFWPVLAGTATWFWIVTYVGLATMLLGAYSAIFQQDLKGVLAYSTVSHLGLITTLMGMNTELALVAAVFHIANHATFKASLFMAAGIIDHETGTRDIRRLGGLARYLPVTATLAIVASAAMAGVPLLNGFISKEMFFSETALRNPIPFVDVSLPAGAIIAGAFAVTYSLRFILKVFFGPAPTGLDRVPHEPPALMRRPIEILVLACLLVGIIPAISIGPILATAVSSILGPDLPYYSLAIWHGFNTPLLMSLVALVGGIVLYLLLRPYLARGIDGPPFLAHLAGPRIFERLLILLSVKWSKALEKLFGTRRLQPQLAILAMVAIVAASIPTFGGIGPLRLPLSGIDPGLTLVWGVGMVCAVGAATQAKYHRLVALMLMGGAGLATSLTFVWYSAPDLALTQLLVEVVTTILILLGMRWLPKRREEAGIDPLSKFSLRRLRDLAIAIVAGGGLALLSYAIMTRDAPDSIAKFFLDNAYLEGGGRNVVNVILVDFRGFDTLGEITVLGIVALTTYALLRRFRPAADSIPRPEQQRIQSAVEDQRSDLEEGTIVSEFLFVPAVIMRWLFPVIMTFSLFLLLRGHDQPGGGFIAGITMAIGFILQYLASGTRWVEDRLRILPVYWIGVGLLLALATGAGAWVFGAPFLTSHFQYLDLPLLGRVPLASALFFDLGVFILVVGATVLMLVAIAHQSLRSAKPGRRPSTPKAVADAPEGVV